MKKNILLYILLIFLIVVNGFFVFNYLGNTADEPDDKQRKEPTGFIVKTLKFDEAQMQQYEKLNEAHRKSLREQNAEARKLKDELFTLTIANNISNTKVDSIISLLGINEQKREKLMFYNLRDIQSICNEKQKLDFQNIIKDALRKSGNGRPPRGVVPPNGQRPAGRMDGPPPHGRPDGPPPEDMPPPRH